jgi:hypothetical protein
MFIRPSFLQLTETALARLAKLCREKCSDAFFSALGLALEAETERRNGLLDEGEALWLGALSETELDAVFARALRDAGRFYTFAHRAATAGDGPGAGDFLSVSRFWVSVAAGILDARTELRPFAARQEPTP